MAVDVNNKLDKGIYQAENEYILSEMPRSFQ